MATVDVNPPVAESRTLRRRMTEEQFVAWSLTRQLRAEWVDGEVQVMNAVELSHDRFVNFVRRLVGDFVEQHKLGEVFGESYPVRLPGQRRRRQPDAFYVAGARSSLVERTQCNGAPDLIVEVVSPDSQTRDRRTKFAEYEAARVPEYWLPDPPQRTFEAYALAADGRYARLPEEDGVVRSTVLTGLYFRPAWVWQLRPPEVLPLLAGMAVEPLKLLAAGGNG